MTMKKTILLILCTSLIITISQPGRAQSIPGIGSVAGLVKRVIKAIDLQVQRFQNKTIWLQNSQKALENQMSKLYLRQIAEWAQKQKDLYDDYYKELWQLKTVITYYHRIKDITTRQRQLVRSYSRAWQLIKNDPHFTPSEIRYMDQVYSGILEATLENARQVVDVVSAFTTQMSDADRMKRINQVADAVNENYYDLRRFNTQNAVLSLHRAKSAKEAEQVKMIYGLP
jgi:hypothetical protein